MYPKGFHAIRERAMELQDKVVIITGGAGGIGAAMGRRFVELGARAVVLADLDGEGAVAAAAAIGEPARGVACDAGDRAAVAALVDDVEATEGPVDLFCANAGVGFGTQPEDSDELWQTNWDVNVMGTVHAARALLPRWRERGAGYLLVTASAAGLLTSLGDAAYTATKHAAVGLAEWISITYGDEGVRVSCLCPQGVNTDMVHRPEAAGNIGTEQVKALRMLDPEDVALVVGEAIADERFLILPHEEARDFLNAKVKDHDAWLGAMRRFQAHLIQQRDSQEASA